LATLLAGLPAAHAAETRMFEGRGSAGTNSSAEVYLLEGSYEHGIDVDAGCVLTAGLFPAHREPAVLVGDVLPADLAVGAGGRAASVGTFEITQPGWATVQIGTGPDCEWRYTVSGEFLPAGREPGPPGALAQPWVLWLGVGAALVILLGLRRQRRQPPAAADPEAPKVTIVDA
jgi:hypothetical protein